MRQCAISVVHRQLRLCGEIMNQQITTVTATPRYVHDLFKSHLKAEDDIEIRCHIQAHAYEGEAYASFEGSVMMSLRWRNFNVLYILAPEFGELTLIGLAQDPLPPPPPSRKFFGITISAAWKAVVGYGVKKILEYFFNKFVDTPSGVAAHDRQQDASHARDDTSVLHEEVLWESGGVYSPSMGSGAFLMTAMELLPKRFVEPMHCAYWERHWAVDAKAITGIELEYHLDDFTPSVECDDSSVFADKLRHFMVLDIDQSNKSEYRSQAHASIANSVDHMFMQSTRLRAGDTIDQMLHINESIAGKVKKTAPFRFAMFTLASDKSKIATERVQNSQRKKTGGSQFASVRIMSSYAKLFAFSQVKNLPAVPWAEHVCGSERGDNLVASELNSWFSVDTLCEEADGVYSKILCSGIYPHTVEPCMMSKTYAYQTHRNS